MNNNPEDFKHVTLMIDGHDSRATYINASDRSAYYSHKLKKSGFRTQVCTDINGMVLFVSDATPCSSNNDGSMLAEMHLKKKVSKYDCIVLDGGYTLFLDRVLATNPHLGKRNFVVPVRKQRGLELTTEEAKFNSVLGSFRSSIESTFGEIGHLFQRFNGKTVVRVSEVSTFTVQFKLACVLRNIKKFVAMGNVPTAEQHTYWMQPLFDFNDGSTSSVYDMVGIASVADKAQDAQAVADLQQQFLSLGLHDDPDDADEELPEGHYEVEKILKHRGPKHRREYLVKWVGFSDDENSWVAATGFDDQEIIDHYEQQRRRQRSSRS
jgi:hypothetical protein